MLRRHSKKRPTMTMSGIAEQELFQQLLLLERRRCERTGGRFGLALIDVNELRRWQSADGLDELAGEIRGAMRETDITGWYRSSSVIAVILTTLCDIDAAELEKAIVGRISKTLSDRLDQLAMRRVRISLHVFPGDDGAGSVKLDPVFYPADGDRPPGGHLHACAKRTMDVVGSVVALTFLAPAFAVTALLIKLTSRGPVLFRQTRVGRSGRPFTCLKFRSMYVGNDHSAHQEFVHNLIEGRVQSPEGVYKIERDPRVTPVGRFLRRTSLDETPQFWNVLRGDMSLVGPRPPIPYEFEKYSLWHRRRILEAKPGLTGEWQVHGRSRTTFDEMVRMDLRYTMNQSIWVDSRILLQTPFAVLSGSGAE
jgi:lipopolysaccharide/colanic/teichoic acid biosynthesis glycosyltransferase